MRLLLCWALVLSACGDDTPKGPEPFQPDVVCPGPGCAGSSDTQLEVAYARTSINPSADNMSEDPFAAFADWNDANCNDSWDVGETADSHPNGAWMAGYGSGRPALGVHADDGLDARTIVIRSHGLTVAMTELDLVGYFHDEIQKIRDLVKQNGDPVDLVLVGSTHVHEGIDSIGIWGRDDAHSGVDDRYVDFINHTVAANIHDAVGRLEPAQLTVGSAKVEDAGGDMSAYVADTRDPAIIDSTLTTLLFKKPDGTPITALVNWSSHPEIEGGRNHQLSADYVNYLRQGLERGFTRMGTTYPVLAPDVMFVNGEVGGLLTGLHTHPIGDDGQPVDLCYAPQHCMTQAADDCFAAAVAQGHGVAAFAHKALAQGAVTVSDAPLGWRSKRFLAHVDNVAYQVAFVTGLFMDTRVIYNWDHGKPIDRDTNTPEVETEETYLTLGPASLVTVPGELLSEFFIGGYQGQYAGTYALIDPMNPNPPDLGKAPAPPYLCELMEGDFRMAFGLTGDFLGYIIPDYDFKLGDTPYISQAPGDHYEETNSIGDRADPELVGTMKQLIQYGRSGQVASACPGR